ncbi:hypothetical protein J7L70_06850 [Candidatus Bathyarchaeota archaeon]|nr:hypothetical protein [Candidatus Bathyarchaeota archaeon]
MTEEYFCGVDGGGSKTLCVLADGDGRVLGLGRSGSSNISVVGVDAACRNIKEAFEKATASSVGKVDYMALAIAGMGSRLRRDILKREVEAMGLSRAVFIESDAAAALMATTLGKPGVVVVSGTGSIVLALDSEGRFHRALGWGYLLDDEGSGFYIGREALRRALSAYDGRGTATVLTEQIPRYFGVGSLADVVDLVSLRRIGVREIADLAPLVVKLAKAGDRVACDILRQACLELLNATLAVIDKAGLKDGASIGVCGGVFENCVEFVEEFSSFLREKAPSARVVRPLFKPVVGALLMAYRYAGKELDDGLMRNLLETSSRFGLRWRL